MRVLRELHISDGLLVHKLQVCEGDLSSIPPEYPSDVLAVSAFDADYTETETSVIGALARAGLSVGALRADPDEILQRRQCWLSKPLVIDRPGLPYKRLVCSETPRGSSPKEAAGYLLTALCPFIMRSGEIASVTTGVLGAGDQGADWGEMLRYLITEVAKYLRGGLRLEIFRIVVRSDKSQQAMDVVDRLRVEDPTIGDEYDRAPAFDVFISYSRRDATLVSPFYGALIDRGLQVFMDKTSLSPGDVWPDRIDQAVTRAKVFMPFISEAFNSSKYCTQESDLAAILCARGQPSLYPIKIGDAEPIAPLNNRHAPRFDTEISIEQVCEGVGQRAAWTSF